MKKRNLYLSKQDVSTIRELIRDPDWDRCDSGEAWRLLKRLTAERTELRKRLSVTLEIAQHYAPPTHPHSDYAECGGECSEAANVWADLHAAHDLLGMSP